MIRALTDADLADALAIVNAAAEAYRGIIPPDRWKEPYMPESELAAEIAAGIAFSGWDDGTLQGVMGVQPVDDVILIRHAYVHPERQGRGIGTALLGRALPRRGEADPDRHLGRRDMGDRLLRSPWWKRPRRRGCCAATGPSPTARSRPRWCWRISGGSRGAARDGNGLASTPLRAVACGEVGTVRRISYLYT